MGLAGKVKKKYFTEKADDEVCRDYGRTLQKEHRKEIMSRSQGELQGPCGPQGAEAGEQGKLLNLTPRQ